MANKYYLNKTGLTYFWGKIKAALAGKQDTLTAGTNITIDANNVISASGGGGGSVGYTTTTATLTVAGRSNNAQTVNVSAVTATSDVIIAAAPASISDYAAAGIYCSAQAAGSLTFSCTTAPTAAITVNLMIFEGGDSIAIDVAGTVDATFGRFEFDTGFTPTVGETYPATFSCSVSSVGYQGDVVLYGITYGGMPTLSPTETVATRNWWVQFDNGKGYLYSGRFSGGETVSLTVYG